MNILVTGGAGFIGSNFINYWIDKYPNNQIVNLDLLTYAGDLNNLIDVSSFKKYHFIKGDICNRSLVEKLFNEYQFDGVIHFAAESHVDNSIKNPSAFVETNVNGTFTLLDVARNYWMESAGVYKKEFKDARFHHISTDEVYGSLGSEGYFTESASYAPNSPYSASKAASDMLVRSYYHTYGMNVVTTNCSNNFGPMQNSEKLIPTIIRKAKNFESIPIYGTGMNIRDWLFVEDHCMAIDLVFSKGRAGDTYLIGGNNEKTNLEIVKEICFILDAQFKEELTKRSMKSFYELVTLVEDRVGHDFRYAIDATKIKNELNWKPSNDFKKNLKKTIDFYIRKDS